MYFDCFKVFINNVLCLIVSAVALACLIGFTVNLQILTLITKSRLNRCKFKHGLIYSLLILRRCHIFTFFNQIKIAYFF
ncbi:hypothetical protein DOL88_05885 [Aggregatibacter aphrophilus]|uniref:Uncharacterized protein n=1 Tax=Aggregatibacter aphrophilus TaxID=732 RepID=A0AAP7GY96_AGGAP|nr:hypothetical protein BBB52_00520 [Aggregatibacter aphrophilus]RMW86006.1 hypothetical protein DOL88_05885 [Aggregatibacter aphrophilus]